MREGFGVVHNKCSNPAGLLADVATIFLSAALPVDENAVDLNVLGQLNQQLGIAGEMMNVGRVPW